MQENKTEERGLKSVEYSKDGNLIAKEYHDGRKCVYYYYENVIATGMIMWMPGSVENSEVGDSLVKSS
jgi:hypothetical protein